MGKPRQRVPFYNYCQVVVEGFTTDVVYNIHSKDESLKNCKRRG